jgi:hypothetical protein
VHFAVFDGTAHGGLSDSTDALAIEAASVTRPPRLARAPMSCVGTKPPPRERISDDLAPLVGAAPLWAGFYARYDERRATLHILRDAPRRRRGWRIKTLWALAADQQAAVTVNARGARGGRLWFEMGNAPQPTLILDPARPGHLVPEGEPLEYGSYPYIPRADCYTFVATSSDGGWKAHWRHESDPSSESRHGD